MSATLITAFLLVTSPAPAQDPDAAARVDTGQTVDRHYIYGDEELQGEVLRENGVRVSAHAPAGFGSLIEIRGAFTDHLVRQSFDMG